MHVLRICKGKATPPDEMLTVLHNAVRTINADQEHIKIQIGQLKAAIAAQGLSIRTLAKKLNMDASNLAKVLTGQRTNAGLLARVQAYLKNSENHCLP